MYHDQEWTWVCTNYMDVLRFQGAILGFVEWVYLLTCGLLLWIGHPVVALALGLFFVVEKPRRKQVICSMSILAFLGMHILIIFVTRNLVRFKYHTRSMELLTKSPHIKTLIVCNHHSHLDFLLYPLMVVDLTLRNGIGTTLPLICASIELAHIPFLSWFIRNGRAFFVRRKKDSNVAGSLQQQVRDWLLNSPDNFMVFPEGTRSRSFGIEPLKFGVLDEIARQALAHDVPIRVCVLHLSSQRRLEHKQLFDPYSSTRHTHKPKKSTCFRITKTMIKLAAFWRHPVFLGTMHFKMNPSVFWIRKDQPNESWESFVDRYHRFVHAEMHNPRHYVLTRYFGGQETALAEQVSEKLGVPFDKDDVYVGPHEPFHVRNKRHGFWKSLGSASNTILHEK